MSYVRLLVQSVEIRLHCLEDILEFLHLVEQICGFSWVLGVLQRASAQAEASGSVHWGGHYLLLAKEEWCYSSYVFIIYNHDHDYTISIAFTKQKGEFSLISLIGRDISIW